MPDEETTTQTEVEESTQKPEETGIGEVPAQTHEETDSTTEGEESTPDWQKKYEDGSRKITEQGQQMAALQQQMQAMQDQNLRYQRAFTELGKQEVATEMSPVELARHKLKEAHESYDPVAISEATVNLTEARLAESSQANLQEFARLQRMNQELPAVHRALNVQDPAHLAQILGKQMNDRTPTKLMLGEIFDRGGPAALAAWATQQKQAEVEKAQTGTLLRTADGQGRGALGDTQGAQQQKWMFFEEWAQLNPEAKERYRKSTESVEIKGAPEGFDPMKD